MLSAGSIMPLFTRPISLVLVIVSAVMLVLPFYRDYRRARLAASGA